MRMKRYIYFVLLLAATTSCKKSDLDIVEKFVQEVKADKGDPPNSLPDFQIDDIEALLKHAKDDQIVSRYPRPPHSSLFGEPVEVGFVMLYAIESILQQKEWPYLGIGVLDGLDFRIRVPLSEVLPFYQSWWATNKGKSAEEIRKTHPLAGSGLTWHGIPITDINFYR